MDMRVGTTISADELTDIVDQVGGTRTLSNGVGSGPATNLEALNGNPVASFRGAEHLQLIDATYDRNQSVLVTQILMKIKDVDGAFQYILDASSSFNRYSVYTAMDGGTSAYTIYSRRALDTIDGAFIAEDWAVFTFIYRDGGSDEIWINDTKLVDIDGLGASASAGLTLGKRGDLVIDGSIEGGQFDFAHLVEYHSDLTDQEIIDNQEFLRTEWGLITPPTPSGTITDDQAAAVEGAIVDIMSADTILGVSAKDEAVVTGAQGQFALDELLYDPTKYYWGVTRSGAVVDSGTATGGSASALIDTGKAFAIGGFQPGENVSYMVRITAGTGAGQERIVSNNTATEVYPHRDFDVAPDNTSDYEIVAIRLGVTLFYPDQETPV